MRTADICPTCAVSTNALCTLYNGEYLECLDIQPLDNLETIIIKINNAFASGGMCVQTTTTTTTSS